MPWSFMQQKINIGNSETAAANCNAQNWSVPNYFALQ